MLGSAEALASARKTALDGAAPAAARKAALQLLLDARVPDLRQIAEPLLKVRTVNGVAASALATFDDPAIAPMLVDAYPQFDAADRPKLIAALSARPASAALLLNAVAAGRVPRSAIAAVDAQQMRALNDAALSRRLAEVWGEVRDTPEAKKQLLTKYKAELTPALLASANQSQGRAVFATSCASCHTLYGVGGKVGPDLTGGERRRDLDSLLSKIVDPSAELPADSRLALVKLKDGRTVSGIIDNRTATTLTLRTTADPITVPLADIQATELSTLSIMPEGLFEGFSAEQRRNLVAYLMGSAQVPLPGRQSEKHMRSGVKAREVRRWRQGVRRFTPRVGDGGGPFRDRLRQFDFARCRAHDGSIPTPNVRAAERSSQSVRGYSMCGHLRVEMAAPHTARDAPESGTYGLGAASSVDRSPSESRGSRH